MNGEKMIPMITLIAMITDKPPQSTVDDLSAQCRALYASYSTAYHDKSPVWISSGDGLRTQASWDVTLECDGKGVIREYDHDIRLPHKHKPYMALMQISCQALRAATVLVSASASSQCRDLEGPETGQPAYTR